MQSQDMEVTAIGPDSKSNAQVNETEVLPSQLTNFK